MGSRNKTVKPEALGKFCGIFIHDSKNNVQHPQVHSNALLKIEQQSPAFEKCRLVQETT